MQLRVNEPYKLIDRGPVRSARTPQQISDVPKKIPPNHESRLGTKAAIKSDSGPDLR